GQLHQHVQHCGAERVEAAEVLPGAGVGPTSAVQEGVAHLGPAAAHPFEGRVDLGGGLVVAGFDEAVAGDHGEVGVGELDVSEAAVPVADGLGDAFGAAAERDEFTQVALAGYEADDGRGPVAV